MTPLILWTLAFLLSFMGFPALEPWMFAGALFALILAAVTAAESALKSGAIVLPRGAPAISGGGFWLLALASVFWSAAPHVSILYFWFFSALPLSALTFLWLEEKQANRALAAVLAAAGVLAVSALVQYLFLPESLFHGAVYWPLDSPNALGLLFGACTLAALGRMLAAEGRLGSNLALIAAIVLSLGIGTTGSRFVMLAVPVFAVCLIAACPAAASRHVRCLVIWVLAGAGGIAGLGFLAPEGALPAGRTLSDMFSGAEPLLYDRPALWEAALAMIADAPLFGSGIGTFFLRYPAYMSADAHSAGFMAHNDPLQFAAEMGLLAPVLFYGFVTAGLALTIGRLRSGARDDPGKARILGPFAALGLVAAHAHVAFPLHVLPTLMVSGVLLALWLRAAGGGCKVPLSLRDPAPARLALTLAGLALLAGFLPFASSEILLSRARAQIAQGDAAGFETSATAALEASFGLNARAHAALAALPAAVLASGGGPPKGDEKGDEKRAVMLRQAQDRLEAAIEVNPLRAESWTLRAELAQLAAEADESEIQLFARRALALDPRAVRARMMLARLDETAGNPESAYRLMREGLGWRYRHDGALGYYHRMIAMALARSDLDTHRRAVESMRVYVKKSLFERGGFLHDGGR